MAYFNDNLLQDKLDEFGFAKIDLLGQNELREFRKLHQEYFADVLGEGMYVSHSKDENSFERNLEISNKIISIARESISKHFQRFRFHVAHFVVKKANTLNEMSLHQDWNIVDESSKRNFHLWFPLHNTNPENGGLFVLPFSHKFFQNFRSGSFDIPRVPTDESIRPYIQPVTLNAGAAVAYKTALFHGSYSNKSNEDRVAIIISLVEEDANTLYYQRESNGETGVYKFETDEFFRSLSLLEKGLVPANKQRKGTLEISAIPNHTINSKQLAECYLKYRKEMSSKKLN